MSQIRGRMKRGEKKKVNSVADRLARQGNFKVGMASVAIKQEQIWPSVRQTAEA